MFSFTTPKALHALLILSIFNFNTPAAAEGSKKVPSLARGRRSEDGYRGSMWFGPRLGKRSPLLNTDDDRQAFYSLLDAADTLKYYYEPYSRLEPRGVNEPTRVTKKVVFTPMLGRSADESQLEDVNFTPRLGRRRGDGVTPADRDTFRNDQDSTNDQSYFSPRLGRADFSPRLGRDLLIDVFPRDAKIRVARSTTNKTGKQ